MCPQDFQGNFHSGEAVLQPNIWLKVLPKSLHQFRKRFQIKWFRRLTLPSGLWFPCCEICFRSTRWPLASPGASVSPHYVIFWPKGRRNHAVLQPNIWLKVLPKSLHQFRKRFQIKWFRRLTLPSGLWFPCCGVCFRCTRWPSAFPGIRQTQRSPSRPLSRAFALCLPRSISLFLSLCHSFTSDVHTFVSGPQ